MFHIAALTEDRIRELRDIAAEVRGRVPDRISPHRRRDLRLRVETPFVTKGGSLMIGARTVSAVVPPFCPSNLVIT